MLGVLTRSVDWLLGRTSLCEQHIWTEEDSQDDTDRKHRGAGGLARRHLAVVVPALQLRAQHHSLGADCGLTDWGNG